MQMTEKGGNKLNGNYDIGIKKWQKGEVFRVFMGLRSDIFITIFSSHQYVCADTILIIYYNVTLVTAPAHRPYFWNLNFHKPCAVEMYIRFSVSQLRPRKRLQVFKRTTQVPLYETS